MEPKVYRKTTDSGIDIRETHSTRRSNRK